MSPSFLAWNGFAIRERGFTKIYSPTLNTEGSSALWVMLWKQRQRADIGLLFFSPENKLCSSSVMRLKDQRNLSQTKGWMAFSQALRKLLSVGRGRSVGQCSGIIHIWVRPIHQLTSGNLNTNKWLWKSMDKLEHFNHLCQLNVDFNSYLSQKFEWKSVWVM